MSAADGSIDQKSTANLVAEENVAVDNCSRLSSASTAPATFTNVPAEVTGLYFLTASVAEFKVKVSNVPC